MRQLKMPYARALAPELIATAKAQRWDPVEVDQSPVRRRSRRPGPVDARHPPQSRRVPHRQNLRRLGPGRLLHPRPDPASAADPGMGAPPGEPRRLRTRPAPGRRSSSKPSAKPSIETGRRVAWFTLEAPRRPRPRPPHRRHRHQSRRPDPARRSGRASTTSACCRSPTTPPKGSTGSSTPPTRNAPSRCRSNLHPAGFDELMPKTLATATVDRLLHHAHVCQTSGDSIRLTQALTGKGVNP